MAPLQPVSLIFLVLISPIALSIRDLPSDQKSSPYRFIHELQGCRKGDSTKGLNKLKHYLQRFGYLRYSNATHLDNDDFDEALEMALMTYQENYHITPTGALDAATVSMMASPRCGVPDVINGVNTMRRKNHYSQGSKSIHTVANYVFFPSKPRWPPSKRALTYRFYPGTPIKSMTAVARAFQRWTSATQYFTFSHVESNEESDLVIGFFSGNHGDGYPFTGPGGTIAHAFPPTTGQLHYDADETWANGPVPDAFDLESVGLHEIGHLLGLGHSRIKEAVMYPVIPHGVTKLDLQQDDIDGVKALYNL